MDDRTNTIFGWVLFAGIVVMGLRFLSSFVYHEVGEHHGDEERVVGYMPANVEAEGGAGPAEMTIAEALNMEGMEPSKGEKVFAKCAACHTVNSGGANGIGPNLYGIMGKPVGKGVPGFAYSSALAEKGGNWDWETMSAWLKKPAAFANGTKMSFAGLSSVEDRAAVMLYMNEQGSSLPVPEFVADVAAGADGESEATEEAEETAEADVEAEAAAEQDAAAEINEGGA